MKTNIVTRITIIIFVTALAAVLIGCGGPTQSTSNTANGNSPATKLVVALKPDKNPDQMIEERASLSKYLSDKLRRQVDVIIPVSAAVINEGFSNGTIDLGYLSANDLINSKDAELLVVGEINGETNYKSYWLALREKQYDAIEDLRGKPIAFASKTSTSGYVIPLWDLKKRGLLGEGNDPDAFFGKGNVFYGTGYVSAVERVLNGQAEAAAVSYYVLDEDKHLSEEQRGRLKKIAEQGPVPTHIIAVRRTVAPDERAKLKQALLDLNSDPNTALRDRVFTSKLVEADQESHLRPLREALSVLPK
jgi:phosphonate transport system substrate-binding protein